MASNSKIGVFAKSELKDFKKSMPKNMAFHATGSVTVLVRVMTNCVQVSTALASPKEKKIRRKVGEFHAMARMNDGYYVALPRQDLSPNYGQSDAEAQAEYFAELFS